MQFNTEFDPETPIERSALRAVKTARWFVGEWRDTNIDVGGRRLRQMTPTLERLMDGILFDMQDETVLEIFEKVIVEHLNALLED